MSVRALKTSFQTPGSSFVILSPLGCSSELLPIGAPDAARVGMKTNSLLPISIPCVSAAVAFANHSAPARWEFFRPPPVPGEERGPRFPLMSVTWIGICVSEDSERARRSSWPPPSSVVPSRCTRDLEGDISAQNLASSVSEENGIEKLRL